MTTIAELLDDAAIARPDQRLLLDADGGVLTVAIRGTAFNRVHPLAGGLWRASQNDRRLATAVA
jgi:hypothetical protein